MTITHTDTGICLFCGDKFILSIALSPDLPFDKSMEMIGKYMDKRQDILLHKLQCEMNYYQTKLEANKNDR